MKRVVSNDEFILAYGPIDAKMGDLNEEQKYNRKILIKVSNRFSNILTDEERHRCMIDAVWHCLEKHIPGMQKFSTSLWRFITWECKREISRKNKKRVKTTSLDNMRGFNIPNKEKSDDVQYIKDCISLLPANYQSLIKNYFFDKMTMAEIGNIYGYSKETARTKLKKAFNKLREICLLQNNAVYT